MINLKKWQTTEKANLQRKITLAGQSWIAANLSQINM